MSGRPIRALNVAEKPSVAKAVSGILSNGGLSVRNGRSRYNKIFEFNYSLQSSNQNLQMSFTSVTGHLMELKFDERFRKWHSCDPVDLYSAPVQKFVPEDKVEIEKTLEEEARNCQWLVLWLDCDREGENIAYEVVEVCKRANPNLNIWRARFSALIPRDIHQAMQNLVRPNQLFAEAVDVRQEIDLRIGASFTRFQTLLLKDAFNIDLATDDRNLILSYGPCQFPTLGFVVERYWEIQAHEPEEFWTINCTHNSDEGVATFSWMRGHLFDHACATILYEMCVDDPIATVTNVRKQEKPKYPPYPLSTIELEKRASRYFRMSSEKTMKVAEDLYQAGFISYPRTETDRFSERTDLQTIVREQQGHPQWGQYAQRLLDPDAGLWRNPSSGGHDDNAHPPIHPTKFSAGESGWSQDHHKVYELVVRHFLACVSQPAIGAETTVEIDIAGEQFSASGRVIIAKNYLDVYRFETWGGSVIPTYNREQQFIPTTLTLDSGVTRPPPLLSEADLLSCMDKAGIGTDATMHDHIKKLLDRLYATKDESMRFSPTPLGEALVMGYDDMGYELWKPYLRAMMESDMKAVSMGTKRKAEVLEACLQQMKACFVDAKINKAKLFDAMSIFFERSNRSNANEQHPIGEVIRKCGVCEESNMVLKKKSDGNFMVGCLGYPQCRNVVWLPGTISEATVTTNTCTTCSPGPVYLIQFRFRRHEIPPSYDANHLGCIGGCDEILKQLVELCGTGSRNNSSVPGRAQGQGNAPTSNGAYGRAQGFASSSSFSSAQQSTYGVGRGGGARQSGGGASQAGNSSTPFPAQTSRARNARTQQVNAQEGESTVSCPSCGAPCNLLTANTEANRGRKFYSCKLHGCDYFCWEDMANSGGAAAGRGSNGRSTTTNNRSGSGGRRGGGRGGRSTRSRSRGRPNTADFQTATTFVSATGEPNSRSCFICGDPSHFANVCPNRGM